MPYVEKRITSGNILEIERYFSPTGNSRSRQGKRNLSSEKQQAANNVRSEKELWRMIHANFSKERGDLFVTFTFANEVEEDSARRLWENFVRRLRRYQKRNSLPDLKYLWKLEKQGCWHIHAVINCIPLQALTKIWGHGRVTSSILDDLQDYKDLAAYLSQHIKEPKAAEKAAQRKRKNARNWSGSLNLKRPAVQVQPIKREDILRKLPKAPKGYLLCPGWNIGCDDWGNLYQYFICRRITAQAGPRKQQRIITRKAKFPSQSTLASPAF